MESSAQDLMEFSFSYRNKTFQVSLPSGSSLRDLGLQLETLTGVAPHTLRLLVPGSPALLPFSDQHSSLVVSQCGIPESRPIRIMGSLPEEIKTVSVQSSKEKGIISFEDEDRRAKQRSTYEPQEYRKLPSGQYIFCGFKTLHIPGLELHPPAEKALEIMHRLASDPGIVAIMNRHRWRVGVMTEMAPVGYVGISPKCILGFNKNKGEEISLRLRTDDLNGFRKYESIKKTLLHELAHMVHSEHDANFHALDKQLNEEAVALDWTRSRGHSVLGVKYHNEVGAHEEAYRRTGEKLGGSAEYAHFSARSAAVQAAVLRLSQKNETEMVEETTDNKRENDLDDHELSTGPDKIMITESYAAEPDPDDGNTMAEPGPDDGNTIAEPDPDDQSIDSYPSSRDAITSIDSKVAVGSLLKADPNSKPHDSGWGMSCTKETVEVCCQVERMSNVEENVNVISSNINQNLSVETVPLSMETISDNNVEDSTGETTRPPIEDTNLISLQEHTEMVCKRLQKAINNLKNEATPSEVSATIQTLLKILRNLMEYPHEPKFRSLRKANATFQNRIAKFKGAMDVLLAVGFSEATSNDCLVFTRGDPVLLWLAKTNLEAGLG